MDDAKEVDYVFNVVHHTSPSRVTPYLVVLPDGHPSLSPSMQVAHIRSTRGNGAYGLAGSREFTVVWVLIPLAEEPYRFLGDLNGEPGEPLVPNTDDFSDRAVGVAYGVAVYNENDAKTGSFFNKQEGRRLAEARLDEYLRKMHVSENQDMTARLADLSVLELSSKVCSRYPSGYLELPRVGRFLYDEVRQFVLDQAGLLISQTLDDDFDFSFYNKEQNELSDLDTFARIYTVTGVGEDGKELTPEGLAEELSGPELDEPTDGVAVKVGDRVLVEPFGRGESPVIAMIDEAGVWPTDEEAKANTDGCGNCANCECNGASREA